ncbi:MAG: hypothetical protein ABIN55_03265, partial [Aeromicrobium sp.]
MKRIVLVLAMMAGTVFLAASPASAEDVVVDTMAADSTASPPETVVVPQPETLVVPQPETVVVPQPETLVVPQPETVTDDATTGNAAAAQAPLAAGGDEEDSDHVKVFVCKFVSKPGEDEVLQAGGNPISVSPSALGILNYAGDGSDLIGVSFNDAHFRSLVIAVDIGQAEPDVSACIPVLLPRVTPGITTDENCDGGDVPTFVAVAGVSYEFTVGDGIAGPWEIT